MPTQRKTYGTGLALVVGVLAITSVATTAIGNSDAELQARFGRLKREIATAKSLLDVKPAASAAARTGPRVGPRSLGGAPTADSGPAPAEAPSLLSPDSLARVRLPTPAPPKDGAAAGAAGARAIDRVDEVLRDQRTRRVDDLILEKLR